MTHLRKNQMEKVETMEVIRFQNKMVLQKRLINNKIKKRQQIWQICLEMALKNKHKLLNSHHNSLNSSLNFKIRTLQVSIHYSEQEDLRMIFNLINRQ